MKMGGTALTLFLLTLTCGHFMSSQPLDQLGKRPMGTGLFTYLNHHIMDGVGIWGFDCSLGAWSPPLRLGFHIFPLDSLGPLHPPHVERMRDNANDGGVRSDCRAALPHVLLYLLPHEAQCIASGRTSSAQDSANATVGRPHDHRIVVVPQNGTVVALCCGPRLAPCYRRTL